MGSKPWMLRRACQGLLILTSLSYLWLCPHSKVEESFSLQATHDLFYHGITPKAVNNFLALGWTTTSKDGEESQQSAESLSSLPYDHLQYPGVVPRSFVGSAILASLCHVIRWVMYPFRNTDLADRPLEVQFWARCILLSFICHGFFRLAGALDRRTKRSTIGSFLLLITAVQFHLPFYASRMLPNTFATALCLHAFAYWVQGQIPKAAITIIVTTAVFRCDVILLLFTGGLSWIFVSRQLTILQALRLGITTGIITLALTVPLDSILWQRPLWPEGEVFFFNTILNKSSEWGVSPWHFYLSSALPKALFLTLPLVPLSIVKIPEILAIVEQRLMRSNQQSPSISVQLRNNLLDKTWLPILMPAFGFVFLYSFLGHKETRFLFPILPLFNMAAAIGLDRILLVGWPPKGKRGSVLFQCAMIGSVLALILTLIMSVTFVAVSRLNYPGGEALSRLSAHVRESIELSTSLEERPLNVYIDVASAMSGVSLFGQRSAAIEGCGTWSFHKSGYEDEHSGITNWDSFTHLLTEDKTMENPNFEIIGSVQGNPWLNWRHARIESSESIFILEHRKWIDEAPVKDECLGPDCQGTGTVLE